MIQIKKFTFNPFQENTYILFDETKECVVIDPGCYEKHEEDELMQFISQNDLKPVRLLNTHCHIDHILGNQMVANTYGLGLEIHKEDLVTLKSVVNYAHVYGFQNYKESPDPVRFLEDDDEVSFGNSSLKVIFGPGHAPGHVAFYSENDAFVVNGDILFAGSFGRVDLPGGSMDVLRTTILNKMFHLPEDTVVYCGHGPETTIGKEKVSNMILHY